MHFIVPLIFLHAPSMAVQLMRYCIFIGVFTEVMGPTEPLPPLKSFNHHEKKVYKIFKLFGFLIVYLLSSLTSKRKPVKSYLL